jgi:hypothetical protein
VFNKDVKVPLQEVELVGTSSSNIYFKLTKTLDALDVVQGTAEDKVVGVGQGTCQNIEDFVDAKCRCNLVNWESIVGSPSC